MEKLYTVGLGITQDSDRKDHGLIYLIKKTKPERQAGHLNLPGGKVEPGETMLDCIVREWREETGVATNPEDWTEVGEIYRPNDFRVGIFFSNSYNHIGASTTTEEELWCITLKNFRQGRFERFETGEVCKLIMPNVETIVYHCLSEDFQKYKCKLNIEFPPKPTEELEYGQISVR